MSDLPAPPISPDVDLSGLDGFILNVNRLLSSTLVAKATPEALGFAVKLWCRAWQQRPACSLPDDDAELAALSGAGKRWRAVRAMALHGFVKCSDGRLYHPVLAEDANRAWTKRLEYRRKRQADNDRLDAWRKGSKKPVRLVT